MKKIYVFNIFLLIFLSMLSIDVFAQREANTTGELELQEAVRTDSLSDASLSDGTVVESSVDNVEANSSDNNSASHASLFSKLKSYIPFIIKCILFAILGIVIIIIILALLFFLVLRASLPSIKRFILQIDKKYSKSLYAKVQPIFRLFDKRANSFRNEQNVNFDTTPRSNNDNDGIYSKINSSEKGWSIDDTLSLEVSYLEIEDVINPIQIANQHEKVVRDMIWKVRKLENTNGESSVNTDIQPEKIGEMLLKTWKRIDPQLVRSVYKRSLFIILESYSEQYPQMKDLIEEIK